MNEIETHTQIMHYIVTAVQTEPTRATWHQDDGRRSIESCKLGGEVLVTGLVTMLNQATIVG